MTNHGDGKKPHFLLGSISETELFSKPPTQIKSKPIPDRDRKTHGANLLAQLQSIRPWMETAKNIQEEAGLEGGFGLQIEFEGFPDIEMAFERLDRVRSGIELLNVRQEDNRTSATVFVPDGKLADFEKLIAAYLEERRDRIGRPRDNKILINSIQSIRAATIRALWTDDPAVFPSADNETFWWEVWLPVRQDRKAEVALFRRLAEAQGFQVASGELDFPERTVLLVYGSTLQMKQSMMTLNSIAELRRAKETADFFDALPPQAQGDWLNDLLERTQIATSGESVPHVCLLDTGVNKGHPLIAPCLDLQDIHTVEPGWGIEDVEGHGTSLAGLSLFGDLTVILDSNDPVEIKHRLESVKLLPTDGANEGDSIHHGYLTTEAVSRPEITAPHRRRVFSMAVTAQDGRDRGRPSAWSAALDRLAVDADGGGVTQRLLMVSAGNIQDLNAWALYPDSNSTEGIHDPGQSWNALTVGAFTDLVQITETNAEEYEPIAKAGGLSPFSTTSCTWDRKWPLKPDVVFEGGNAAKDAIGAVWMPSLSLLTSHHVISDKFFTTANATSAATALAARMAAQLMAAYPDLWPETIRALIVHSAQWTPEMKRMFLPQFPRPPKKDVENLIRHCGYGVPDLDRAMWSISNSLTMVVEDRLHPFQRESNKQPLLRDMHLHRLPWPLNELESLGETQVEMRVTLSYFIEPNPSERGFRSRYLYESHGLRFDVKRPIESEDDFRARVNAAARDEETGTSAKGDGPEWTIGKQNRHKGSIHSDIWTGKAADLASRGVIAVYPGAGWWKSRPRFERYNNAARYSLIVSIHAPEIEVDLYNAVANQIETPVLVGQ